MLTVIIVFFIYVKSESFRIGLIELYNNIQNGMRHEPKSQDIKECLDFELLLFFIDEKKTL
jgi:hypothetical protein